MLVPQEMNAAVLTKYRNIEYLQVPVPSFTDDQVLVKIGYAGICGSDQHIFNGDFHPRTKPNMIPGHEFAGTIVATGKNVENYNIGDRVAVDPIIPCGTCAACELGHFPACTSLKLLGVDTNGGFAEYVTADVNMLYKLDNAISERDAAMVEIFSIGFHACNRAQIKENDTAVIWGAGRVGQSILQAARTKTDNKIIMIDVLPDRLKIAQDNFENVYTVDINRQDPLEVVKQVTNGRGVDVAFEAVGHGKEIKDRVHPVRGCVQSIRGAGTVCVLGLADDPVPLIMKELIWREGRIVASRVSHGEFKEAIHHLSQGHLKPDALISNVISPDKIQDAFIALENEPEKFLKVLIKVA